MVTLAHASLNRAEKSQSGRLIKQMGYATIAKTSTTVTVATNLRKLVYVSVAPKDKNAKTSGFLVYVPTVDVANNAVTFMRPSGATGTAVSFWYELTGYL